MNIYESLLTFLWKLKGYRQICTKVVWSDIIAWNFCKTRVVLDFRAFRVPRYVKQVVIGNGGIRYGLACVCVWGYKTGICSEPWRSIDGTACAGFWLVTPVEE